MWKNEFYVVALADFVGISLHKDVKGSDVQVHVQRVRECAIETDEKGKPLVRFPLKEKYDRTNSTIEGLEAAAGIDDALFDCPPETPDALAVPDVVNAVAVDDANEQVGFEGLVLESGGDEEGVVVEAVKMPVPKAEVKDDSETGGRGGGLSPAVHAGGDFLPAQQPLDERVPSSSSSHVAPPGLSLDTGSGGSKPVDKSVHGVSYVDKDGILRPIPSSAPPGAIRKHPLSGHWLDKGGFRLFKGSDRPPGFDPASWNILRPEHKAQVIKDLKTAEQASGVGGLHASLPSDAKDEPAAPVRTVLSSRLSAEACAFCPATGAPFVCVVSDLQNDCIVPAMPVISVIEALTVREHREKVVDAPMSAFALVARPVGIEERKRTPAAWAACEKEWVGLRSAGKRGCWDEAKVREMTHVEREAKASGKKVHFGRVHELCFVGAGQPGAQVQGPCCRPWNSSS